MQVLTGALPWGFRIPDPTALPRDSICQLLLITCHEAWFDVQSSTMNVGRTWEKNIAPKAIDV